MLKGEWKGIASKFKSVSSFKHFADVQCEVMCNIYADGIGTNPLRLLSCSMDKIVSIWGVPAAFGMIKSLWDCE
jgi:hypothetical protein